MPAPPRTVFDRLEGIWDEAERKWREANRRREEVEAANARAQRAAVDAAAPGPPLRQHGVIVCAPAANGMTSTCTPSPSWIATSARAISAMVRRLLRWGCQESLL